MKHSMKTLMVAAAVSGFAQWSCDDAGRYFADRQPP